MEREAVAKRIRVYTERAGLGIPDVARRCGVSRQTVWLWSRGLCAPSLTHLGIFVEVVGTDLVSFFGPLPRGATHAGGCL